MNIKCAKGEENVFPSIWCSINLESGRKVEIFSGTNGISGIASRYPVGWLLYILTKQKTKCVCVRVWVCSAISSSDYVFQRPIMVDRIWKKKKKENLGKLWLALVFGYGAIILSRHWKKRKKKTQTIHEKGFERSHRLCHFPFEGDCVPFKVLALPIFKGKLRKKSVVVVVVVERAKSIHIRVRA